MTSAQKIAPVSGSTSRPSRRTRRTRSTNNRCGRLADKFGVPWQIVPRALPEMLQSGDAARTQRVMRAMFEMKKLDVAKLRRAFGPNQEEVS